MRTSGGIHEIRTRLCVNQVCGSHVRQGLRGNHGFGRERARRAEVQVKGPELSFSLA